ncbi:unnamed protein product [Symbiodinium pilosum]|uniref:Uncharacterized protein n=1 Tax=Symbiodinium pilosum TaxID=2952 RepID=A0A812JZD6_SYMPI|nr:unnamed protein product [Symbiodinium pilosum]
MEWSLSGQVASFVSKQLQPAPPSGSKPKRAGLRRALYASKITESLTPRQQTATEVGLQRKACILGHFSNDRPTPALYDKAYDFMSRGFAEMEPASARRAGTDVGAGEAAEDEEVLIPPLLLRIRVAKSVRDYEAMRDADSPPPEALVHGVRSLRSLQQIREEESAATKIQAKFRQKQAAGEVQRLKEQQKEESEAAARIQAKYRGRQAEKQVQEMREQKQAATAIQSRYRQRAAERRQKEQETASATRIQSKFRQKQAASEVQSLRQKHCGGSRAHDRKQMLDEFRRQIAVKVQVVLDSGKAIINVHLAAKEKLQGATDATGDNSDIPMNDETAGAATKIQARFRQRQAAQEVEAMRRGNERENNKGQEQDTADGNIDIPMNEETAGAATKIQARFRQKQAAQEVEAMRRGNERENNKGQEQDTADGNIDIPMNEETAGAATKIQARFRQKQAAQEVEAMRTEKGQEMREEQEPDEPGPGESMDIPVTDETADAATKIQAKFRQKQAAQEVEAKRKEKEETVAAATKIQAKFRQQQAKTEVDALRKKGQEVQEVQPDKYETDVDLEGDLTRPDEQVSEVEAMLKEKEKEQHHLVEEKSERVEGMFGTQQEKRPMAFSPAIPEGDEE